MVEKKPQKLRFTEEELSLIKNTFAERDDLLLAIRKVMLQLDLPEREDIMLREIMKENVAKVIKKFILPELDGNAPLFQLASMWMNTLIKAREMNNEKAFLYIEAREIEEKYISQQLDVLTEGKGEETIKHAELKEKGKKDFAQRYIDLIAWDSLISFIDSQLMQIKLVAGTKKETEEEQIKRLNQDSNK